MQSVAAVLAVVAVVECDGQLVQTPDPEKGLYVPVAHASHDTRTLPVYPGLQEQSVADVLAVPAVLALATHDVQVAGPAVDLYVP